MRARAFVLGTLLLLTALLTACTTIPSRIVVVMDTDLPVPAIVNELVVRVTTPSGPRSEVRIPLWAAIPRPISLVIEQREGGPGAVEVEVEGRIAGRTVVRHFVRTGFVAGRTVALDVFLHRVCEDVVCDEGATCLPCGESTCELPFQCGRRDVPPEDLRPIARPGDELDASVPGLDAAIDDDADGRDTGGRDTGMRDTGIRDTAPDTYGTCVPDPCAGRMCPELCRAGMCERSCAPACLPNQRCLDGLCILNPCFGVTCSWSRVCDPADGACVVDACVGVTCPMGSLCDPLGGRLLDAGPGPSDAGPALSPPELLSPHNGASTGSFHSPGGLSVRLTWRPSARATLYEVQLTDGCRDIASCALTPSPFDGLAPAVTPTTMFEVSAASVPATGERLYWRVRACADPMTCGGWSAVRYVDVGWPRDDVDGDGYSDVVVAGRSAAGSGSPDTVMLFRGGPMGLAMWQRWTVADLAIPLPATLGDGVALADVNGDGLADVHAISCAGASCVGSGFHAVWTWVSTGAGVPMPAVTLSLPPRILDIAEGVVDAGDVNADGYRDVAVNTSMGWAVVRGAPAAALPMRMVEMTSVTTPNAPTGDCDIDVDGLADLVWAAGPPGVTIRSSRTGLRETWAVSPVTGAATCGDRDGDGLADLAATDEIAATLRERIHDPLGLLWLDRSSPLPAPFGPGYDQMRLARVDGGRQTWVVLAAPDLDVIVSPMIGGMVVPVRTLDPLSPGGRLLAVAQDPFGRGGSTLLIGLPDAPSGGSLALVDEVMFTLTFIEGVSESVSGFGTAVARLELSTGLARPDGTVSRWLAIYDVLSPG